MDRSKMVLQSQQKVSSTDMSSSKLFGETLRRQVDPPFSALQDQGLETAAVAAAILARASSSIRRSSAACWCWCACRGGGGGAIQ